VARASGSGNRPGIEAIGLMSIRTLDHSRFSQRRQPRGAFFWWTMSRLAGATLMGAARRLRETFPGVPIEAFALARVQGAGDIDCAAGVFVNLEPTVGVLLGVVIFERHSAGPVSQGEFSSSAPQWRWRGTNASQ
jgi:hypothetical protein